MKVLKLTQMIYDDLKTRTIIEEVELDNQYVIPSGSYQSKRKYDLYIDYFADYDDVLEYLEKFR